MNAANDRQRALIGAIGLALVLAIGLLMLRAAGGAYGDDYQLTAVADRAGFGLDTASTVKVRGVTVGSVESVNLQDDGTVLITMNIRKEVKVAESTEASIEPLSVFGPKFVDLRQGAGEADGPYLDDGARIANTVAPSEIIETLDQVSTLLSVVDENKVASILTELSRSVDGLGPEIGQSLDNASEIAAILRDNRDEIDALLADANLIGDTFRDRGDEIVNIAENSTDLLDTVIANEDEFADILRSVSHLSTDLAGVVNDSSADLDAVVSSLDRVSLVLFNQLAQVPDFVEFTERTFRLLGEDLPQWDIGNNRLGLLLQGVITLDPCAFLVLEGCAAPPPMLDRP